MSRNDSMGMGVSLITTEARNAQGRMRFLFFRKNAVFSAPLRFKRHERGWASGHPGRARVSRADEHCRGSRIAREFFWSWLPRYDSVAPYRSTVPSLPKIPAPSPPAAERSSSEWDYHPIRNQTATERVRLAAATGHSVIKVVREV
jgi:hypothetical protein